MAKIPPRVLCNLATSDRGFTRQDFKHVGKGTGPQLDTLVRRGLVRYDGRNFYTPTYRGLKAMDSACEARFGRR